MKTRNSFVSNSSTTSFMVCFKPEPKDLSLKTFDFILRGNGSNAYPLNLEVFKDTVKDRKENLLREQKALNKDLVFLADRITKLSKYQQDTKLMQKLEEIDTELTENNIRFSREIAKINKKKEEKFFVNKLSKNFHTMINQIEKIKEKLNEISKQYDLIKDFPDTSIIAKWKEDANSSSFLKQFVDEFESDKRIIVLQKITN